MNYAFINVTNNTYVDFVFLQLASTTVETSELGEQSARALNEEKVCRY